MGRRKSRRAPSVKLAIAYLRVSTTRERQELGEAGQRAAIERWALANGVTVAAWHVEAVSGGANLDARPVLLDALADVLAHRAGALVFSTLDRFSRDPLTAAMVEGELARVGAELVFADGSGNGSDPTAEMVRSIRLAVARFERRMIGVRIKAALAVKQSRGEMTGAPRLGYRLAADGVHVEADAAELAAVARARALHEQGQTVRAIAATLAAEGHVGRGGKPRGRSAVHAMLG